MSLAGKYPQMETSECVRVQDLPCLAPFRQTRLAQISLDLAAKGYSALLSAQLQPVAQFPRGAGCLCGGLGTTRARSLHGRRGTYRFRRYSRFLLRPDREAPEPLQGTSIFKTSTTIRSNGGVVRTFAPLEEQTLQNPFLHSLILHDAAAVNLPREQTWQVGVHLVRILARPDRPRAVLPEGVHIDAERYTVQHLVARQNVQGGSLQQLHGR